MSDNSALHRLVAKVTDSQKYMVAAWVVEDGKIRLMDRITHQFPTGDFLAAIGQLANNCHEEKLKCNRDEKLAAPREQLPSDPLPQVKVFKMPCVSKEETGNPISELWKGPFQSSEAELLPEDEAPVIELPTNENGKTE